MKRITTEKGKLLRVNRSIQAEGAFGQLKRNRHNEPVNINCDMEDLIPTAMRQNYIPVIDDEGIFIGIVTRKSIMTYVAEQAGKK